MNTGARFWPGALEGFYGVFYTAPEREDLIRWLGRHGFTDYLYGPKNDRKHRARWREAYPQRIMEEFAGAVQTARSVGMRFHYAISPGLDICYSSEQDFAALTCKLCAFYDIGVRDFALFLDDNEPGMRYPADSAVYTSLADAQASLANRLLDWLLALDETCSLTCCPAEYWGAAPFSPALVTLAAGLDARIDLYYTGQEICSASIAAQDITAFTTCTGRAPILWDNYPVNDLAMEPELHLDALAGREPALIPLVKGVIFNLSPQAEMSKIPLYTAASFVHCGEQYEPSRAFAEALEGAAGSEYAPALRLLAEVGCVSCLGHSGQTLEQLAQAGADVLRAGAIDSPPVKALEEYLTAMDEAGYTLKFHMQNLALRNNLLPWIEIFEHWMWLARYSLRTLRAIEQGRDFRPALSRVHEYCRLIDRHPKIIATPALMKIAEIALEKTAGEGSLTQQP